MSQQAEIVIIGRTNNEILTELEAIKKWDNGHNENTFQMAQNFQKGVFLISFPYPFCNYIYLILFKKI